MSVYKECFSDISYIKALPKAPDFDGFKKVLQCKKSEKPRLFEFFLNEHLYTAFADEQDYAHIDNWFLRYSVRNMSAYKNIGYDYSTQGCEFGFPRKANPHSDRSYSLNEVVTIENRADYESYAFPDPNQDSVYAVMEKITPYIPEGMKLIGNQPGGLLENVIGLCGYDALCFMLYDDPDLAKEIFDRIGNILTAYVKRFAAFDTVGAMIINDDWGFNTQTMISHDDMRKYVLPHIKNAIDACHAAGKPTILHSCGCLGDIYEDLISIGLDAKHSFEDVIDPIENVYDKYKGRLALMGGIDLNYVCTQSPEAVFNRSKAMLERGSEGGYALGTGNSVPYYVPSANYVAMVAAALV